MYRKYTYWMTGVEAGRLEERLAGLNIDIFHARKAVCVPLSRKVGVGIVRPEAWSKFEICKRQLSWYGVSDAAGKYLVVSDRSLTEYGVEILPETVISEFRFKPDRLPGKDPAVVRKLAENPVFTSACPQEFMDISATTDQEQDRWMKLMGVRNIGYQDLLQVHCANHANFMVPEFYKESSSGKIPYSIGKTNRSCSACLQFFNIIGREFKEKYVVPCPGAVLFAGMAVNRYYRVTSGLPSPDAGA